MNQEKMQGGFDAGVDQLYREVILDHFKSPKNRGSVTSSNVKAEGLNPLCGDQIHITGRVDGDRLVEIRFEGHGCAISQSAASIMTELVKGKPLADVAGLAAAFKQMFGIAEGADGARYSIEDLGDLVALEGVKKYPVRIKCAVLSANTLLQGVADYLKTKGI